MAAQRKSSPRLIWIEAFLAAEKHGSISAAAMAMKCDQSGVTRYIADLETWLGTRLFSSKVPLKLSEEGDHFLDDAKTIVSMLYRHRTMQAINTVWIDRPPS